MEKETLQFIRRLFKPRQPAVKKPHDIITYNEYMPEARIDHIVYCFWHLKTSSPLEHAYKYRVVADGCTDIFLNVNKTNESFVMGFCKKYTEFELGQSFNYFGIRFLPSMFTQVFNISAKSLSNRYEWLEKVDSGMAGFLARNIKYDHTEEAMTTLTKEIEMRWRLSKVDYDHRFYDALKVILEKKGIVEIERDLNTGLSGRQLQRIFNHYIGISPKTFSKVVRFQHILSLKPSTQSLRNNKVFYEFGFYDQAHFIKDFKKLYGVTPTQAFR